MPRLGRRSAGEQVAARAQRLSDDLLHLEETCYGAVDAAFAAAVDPAGRALAAAWRRAKDDPRRFASDARLLPLLATLHAEVLGQSRPHVAALAGQVRNLALEAIADELLVCERTLGKKYEGITGEALLAATDRSEGLVTDRMAAYEQALTAGQDAFERDTRQQVLMVGQRGEDQERAARRLFNPEPNSLPGNGGRGIWWRATSGLHRAALEVSIRLTSATRLAAMEEFNAAGRTR